jgi:hypothetical protein
MSEGTPSRVITGNRRRGGRRKRERTAGAVRSWKCRKRTWMDKLQGKKKV